VVGAGQRLGPIYAALAQENFYIPAGTCGGVGVSGLILGGGVGHATRAAGITSDTVISAEVGRHHAARQLPSLWPLGSRPRVCACRRSAPARR
jgi:hypothetical protein